MGDQKKQDEQIEKNLRERAARLPEINCFCSREEAKALLRLLDKARRERDTLQEKLDRWECRDAVGVDMAKLKQENAALQAENEQLKNEVDRFCMRIE